MTAYLYKTKPSDVAQALVEYPDGSEHLIAISLYRYAYKPSWDERFNQRMHFRSGAQSSVNAWDRSDAAVPAYGVIINGGENTIYAETKVPFRTEGSPIIEDDSVKRDVNFTIKEWVHLPKKITVALPFKKCYNNV